MCVREGVCVRERGWEYVCVRERWCACVSEKEGVCRMATMTLAMLARARAACEVSG